MGSAKHCTICKLSSMLESVSLYNLQTVQILSCGSKHFSQWQSINAVNDMHQVASTNKRKFVGDCKVYMVTQNTIPEHSFFSYMFYELEYISHGYSDIYCLFLQAAHDTQWCKELSNAFSFPIKSKGAQTHTMAEAIENYGSQVRSKSQGTPQTVTNTSTSARYSCAQQMETQQ